MENSKLARITELAHIAKERELTEEEKARQLKKDAHHANSRDKRFIAEDGDWELWQPLRICTMH